MSFQSRSRFKAILLIVFVAFLSACVRRTRIMPGTTIQTGIASWYGPDFHGRPTSNREIYDMHDLTAAHKTLPFGTRVMVTNLDNGRAVSVRINDRGPFVKDRIIDLSYAAARLLDMVGPGTAPVRLDILKSEGSRLPEVRYTIQVGSFVDKERAFDLKKQIGEKYGEIDIIPFTTTSQTYFRVRLKAKDRPAAEEIARRLSADGYPVLICEVD